MLVLLHGLAVTAAGSFGALREPRRNSWHEVQGRFGSDVYAFEHRSLSRGAIANALGLARQLPAGARLRLPSHSTGGLVGELLCRGERRDGGRPFDDADRDLLRERPADLEALEELGELLVEKRPVVERFVRVGCPARGTTLSFARLSRVARPAVHTLGRFVVPGGAVDACRGCSRPISTRRPLPASPTCCRTRPSSGC